MDLRAVWLVTVGVPLIVTDSTKGFEFIRTRWPNRPVDPNTIWDTDLTYDWGFVPPVLFVRAIWQKYQWAANPADVQHGYWRVQYDLFGEYAFTVRQVERGAPFAIPVTWVGQDLLL